ncbi:MAG: transcriptional repressor LexA [Oscillospiraceae bacterium]|nr:transcriptional repressor LexA [Oscillospiraceae bacterium]
MANKLTPKQQLIYDYILKFTARHGYPPAVREIATAVGLRSPSTVHFHLKALEEAGMILRGTGKTRAITLVEGRGTFLKNMVPLLGSVAAGSPIWADQVVEDYIPFEVRDTSHEYFALKVRGDSMIKAGILPGDIVIVRQQAEAGNGEIVIALLGEEATCKRYERRDDTLWLMPENDAYEPIDGTDAEILGRVIGIVRRYD